LLLAGRRNTADYEKSMHAAIIPLFLALAGPPETHRVEVNPGADVTGVLVYDGDEVTAEIVLWSEGDDRVRLDANFDDGEYLRVVVEGDKLVEFEASPDLAGRMAAVEAAVRAPRHDGDTEGWGACALHAVMAVAEFASANPWAIASTIAAACECLPEIVDEFEGYHCPGFG
jgi:hypothetical protein